MTELFNHGTVVEVLADALEVARGSRAVVAVALLDVDNFTLVNEVHGHVGRRRAASPHGRPRRVRRRVVDGWALRA